MLKVKNYKWLILIVALIMVAGGAIFAVKKLNSNEPVAQAAKEKQQDPYQNLSKQKAVQVKAADKAVTKLLDGKLATVKNDEDKPTPEELNTALVDATAKVAAIAGEDTDTKAIRQSYTDITNVVKDPSVKNVQTARTDINNLKDDELKDHLVGDEVKKMIEVSAITNKMEESDVKNQSKPLTAAQVKAQADAEAKAKADAAAKAAADAKAAAQAAAAAEAQAAATAEANRQAAEEANNQYSNNNSSNNYGSGGGSSYNSGQGSTPADNSAAQAAASSEPAPNYGSGSNTRTDHGLDGAPSIMKGDYGISVWDN